MAKKKHPKRRGVPKGRTKEQSSLIKQQVHHMFYNLKMKRRDIARNLHISTSRISQILNNWDGNKIEKAPRYKAQIGLTDQDISDIFVAIVYLGEPIELVARKYSMSIEAMDSIVTSIRNGLEIRLNPRK